MAQRGKRRLGTLHYGNSKKIVKDRKKELGSGLIHDMLGNPWLDLDELRKKAGDAWRPCGSGVAGLVPDAPNGRILVRFPDLPEAVTEGDDAADAGVQVANCPAEAIAGRIDDRTDPATGRSAGRRGGRAEASACLQGSALWRHAHECHDLVEQSREAARDRREGCPPPVDAHHRGSRLVRAHRGARGLRRERRCGPDRPRGGRVFGHAATSGAARAKVVETVG